LEGLGENSGSGIRKKNENRGKQKGRNQTFRVEDAPIKGLCRKNGRKKKNKGWMEEEGKEKGRRWREDICRKARHK